MYTYNPKYRFDNAYQKVYEYDKELHCYIFIGMYSAFDITLGMCELEKIEQVEDWYNMRDHTITHFI